MLLDGDIVQRILSVVHTHDITIGTAIGIAIDVIVGIAFGVVKHHIISTKVHSQIVHTLECQILGTIYSQHMKWDGVLQGETPIATEVVRNLP